MRKVKGTNPKERCGSCEYCREVTSAPISWSFNGCFHDPYKGTWVAEIKDCPKTKKECEVRK